MIYPKHLMSLLVGFCLLIAVASRLKGALFPMLLGGGVMILFWIVIRSLKEANYEEEVE